MPKHLPRSSDASETTDIFDAVLAGRPTDDPAISALSSFVDDVRSAAGGPLPTPKPNLMAMLAGGFSTEKGDLPATAASNVTGPAPQVAGLPMMRRNTMRQGFAKLAGLGLVAKVALGAGVAAASVTTAGVAGTLPDPAQNVMEDVVAAVTPFNISEHVKNKVPDDVDLSTTPAVVTDADEEGDTGDDTEATEHERKVNHGLCVSTAAKDDSTSGRDHGKAVSEVARSDCGKPESTTTSTSSTSSTSTTLDENNLGTAEDSGDSGDKGKGRSDDHPAPGDNGSGQGGEKSGKDD